MRWSDRLEWRGKRFRGWYQVVLDIRTNTANLLSDHIERLTRVSVWLIKTAARTGILTYLGLQVAKKMMYSARGSHKQVKQLGAY
jgi:hypothetical protein